MEKTLDQLKVEAYDKMGQIQYYSQIIEAIQKDLQAINQLIREKSHQPVS